MYISDRSPRLSVLIQNAKRFLAYQIINYLKEDNNIELLNNLKTGPTKNKAKHQVFQPRYDSLMIYNTKMFLQKLDYIHHNPCQKRHPGLEPGSREITISILRPPIIWPTEDITEWM
jgi:hypothetical protein